MSVGSEYKAMRRMQGLKIVDISKRSGVSTSQISNFETGKYGVSLAVYKLLVEALGYKLVLRRIDDFGNVTYNDAALMDVPHEWQKRMKFDELKAEAHAQGYSLMKRQRIEKLIPCTCGCRKRKRMGKWIGNEREEILICYRCGKRASGFSKAEANHNWNEMIRAELSHEE